MNYGDNIRSLRIRLGLTQAALAKKIKIHQVTISAWEQGRNCPQPGTVKKLLKLAEREKISVRFEDLRPV